MKKDKLLYGDMRKDVFMVVALCKITFFLWLFHILQKVNLLLGELTADAINFSIFIGYE